MPVNPSDASERSPFLRSLRSATEGGVTRREFVRGAVVAATSGWMLRRGELTAASVHADDCESAEIRLAPFRFDVTPPPGHSLCGGWIKPVTGVDDALEALGFVLLGCGEPIVLCAVDWTGILNEAHVEWRQALAAAAGTTPERVAVQCVHQHNAPFACLEAQRIVDAQDDLPDIVSPDFFRECLVRARKTVREALKNSRPVSHVAEGQAKVEKVASNRRVSRDGEGRVRAMRGSSCRDERLRALPEGPIDPWLKTLAFYSGDARIATCHYYATHPMSYYGDGRVSSDFVGLARKRRQREDGDGLQLYFTGCAGDVAAGKYNDGSKEARATLSDRIYSAMERSEKSLVRKPLESLEWRTVDLIPAARSSLVAESLGMQIADRSKGVVHRSRPSFMLSWLRRLEKRTPIILSSLGCNHASVLHLPAECFVAYQLRAQKMAPERFVATAAYGDGGPWYIPTKDEYPAGGYEVSVAFCDPALDGLLTQGIRELLA